MPSIPNQPKMTEILAKTHPNCIKNAHRGNLILKKFSGEIPRTPLKRGGIPPLVLSPNRPEFRALGTRSDCSWTGSLVGAITFALILQKFRLRLSYTCAHKSGAFALSFGVTLALIYSQLFLDQLLVFEGRCWNVYSQNVYSHNVYFQNDYSHNVYCAKMSVPIMSTMSKFLLPKCPFLPQDKNKKDKIFKRKNKD